MKNNLGNKETMAKNIQYYMDLNAITRNDLCSALDTPYTTVRDWLKAVTYPRIDKIERMANYFGITKADLVEEKRPDTQEDARPTDPLDAQLDMLLKNASIETKQAMIFLLESLQRPQ